MNEEKSQIMAEKPNLLPREKSAMRKKKYKELLDFGGTVYEKSDSTDVVSTLNDILQIVKISNRINEGVKIQEQIDNTTEVVMDAQIIKMSHELMGTALKRMGDTEFSDDEYFNVLHTFLGPTEDWSKLENVAASVAKTAKWSQSLFGAFRTEPLVKPEPKKRAQNALKKTQSTQQAKPESVNKLQKEEKRAQKLKLVLNQICEYYETHRESIPYYQLIIDPNDFMNTVDNAFQVSFLFRDGSIYFGKDDDGFPNVRPVSNSEKAHGQTTDQTFQFISSLNPRICEEMIEKYNITEPMLMINREELNQTQLTQA